MKRLLYIDLFCGAGGTSTGVNTARLNGEQCAEVIACVNHDEKAIASNASNHPDALHFTEDIRTLGLSPLIKHLQICRAKNPEALTVLWASLECTNFSKAKGGKPRDADSRTLAEHLFRYIEAIDPDYIQIENVEEFMCWGDLDENGRPVSKDRGRLYTRWVNKVKKYGYEFDFRILNAADYGAYTSRKRFFGIFAKKPLPIVFPKQTHCKSGLSGLFGTIPKWKPVLEVLDFDDKGESIFTRKKPLSEKTLERIYAGLIKFVVGGKKSFIVKYNSMSQRGKYVPPSLDAPCPTIATQGRLALASAAFRSKQFSGAQEDKNISVDEPSGTITTIDHHAFVSAYYSPGYNISCKSPAPTLTTRGRLSFVPVCYGNGFNTSCESPAATLTTKDRMSLMQTSFLDMQYGNSKPSSIETAAGTVTTNPKHHLVTAHPYLVATGTGGIAIEIYETDSPMTVKIKEFMAIYNITDITMRMLKIQELKRIMGFHEDYVLIGTQADQKKFIGNAVEVNMSRALCEALCKSLTTDN